MADEETITEEISEPESTEAPEVTEPEAAPPPATEPTSEPITESDWRAAIQDEKIKGFAERFTSPADMAKAAFEMRQRMSKQISLPGEDASEEDVAKFRNAMGVPDDPGDYSITPPEDYEISDNDIAILELIAPLAQEHNIPASAFDDFASAYLAKGVEIREEVEAGLDQAQREASEMLEREWGQDTQRNFELSKRFADTGGDDFVQFLSSAKIEGAGLLGDHPAMVKFLAENGSRFLAEGSMEMMGTRAERSTAAERIDQLLQQNPVGSEGYKDPKFQKELQGLFELVHGNEGVVGSSGRAF